MRRHAVLEHLAELAGRPREYFTVALVDDHPVAADGVEQVDLTGTETSSDRFGVFLQPTPAVGTDRRPLPRGRFAVNLKFEVLGVDRGDDDAVVLAGALDGDVVVNDVFQHQRRVALQGIAVPASTRGRTVELVPFLDR